ncbi:NAD-specific glutamate dehydrogenase [Mycolicibacterium vaccae ATCC 25954]|uniref:NAD-specific glutamate dehydrogenase n=1 Tax=Mycolicibacterium vaccae ATCC 25954 TaxID=1194972 RepID=K0VEI1_MYCVA|nr:NAD-specific glutamate dehydrogenase [Mycolicibacterium vaccae ATCC 25954]
MRSLALLVVLNHLGVDHVVVGRTGRAGGTARSTCGLVGLSGLVDRLAQGLALLAELLHRRLDGADVGAGKCGLGVGDRGVDLGQRLLGNLGSAFGFTLLLDELLRLVDQRLGLVADVGLFATLTVLVGVRLGVLDHPVDLLLGQAGAFLDLDRVLLAGALVLGGHVHDAVGVDVEGDLDLRDTARGRRDAGQLEGTEQLVVRGDLTLALEHLDLHRRLVVVGRGEGLRALGRDRGVAFDELGHHAALGLDTERERGDVKQQNVFDLTLEHTGLQGGADGDDLVRVDALVGLLAAGHLLDQIGDRGHARGTTDQHDVVDVADGDAGVLDHLLERLTGAVQQILGDALELGARELFVEEQRVLVRVDGDVGQVDRGALRARQLDLGLLGRFPQPLHRHLVLGQVDAAGALELVDEPFDDPVVPVVAAEVVVTGGGTHLDHALADLQQGHVERAAAEVEDQDGLLFLTLVEPVGQRGRGRLVDDAQHVEAGDLAGFLGGLTLRVVEVRRHGDDRVGDVLPQVALGVALELHQHARADLLRGVVLAVDFDGPVRTHVPLDRPDGPVDVGHRLVLGGLADQHLAVARERDDRRGGPGTL